MEKDSHLASPSYDSSDDPSDDVRPTGPNLHSNLRSAIAAETELLAVLEREHKALEDRVFLALHDLESEKARCLERIAKLADERAHLSNEFNPAEFTHAAVAAHLRTMGDTTSVALLAEEHELLLRCRDANERNGRLMALVRSYNQRFLNLLDPGSNPLYGPKGLEPTHPTPGAAGLRGHSTTA